MANFFQVQDKFTNAHIVKCRLDPRLAKSGDLGAGNSRISAMKYFFLMIVLEYDSIPCLVSKRYNVMNNDAFSFFFFLSPSPGKDNG